MRPRVARRKTYCPHCRRFAVVAITERAAKKTKGGFPFFTCFDCINRRAAEAHKPQECGREADLLEV